MDNPVDHIVDIGLVNYVKHPSNKDYIVFRFADENRAISFEEKLKENDIWFEKGNEQKTKTNFILFGIHKHDFKKVQSINFDVEAVHKKPIIPFRFFRIFLLLFFFSAITLALVGYCNSQNKLSSHNNSGLSVNTGQLPK